MLYEMLKSKLHRATITDANLQYEGSLSLDEDLIEAANMLIGEKVQIVNEANGARFETYIIRGQRGSGTVCLNGPAARLGQIGDKIIIITYVHLAPEEAKEYQPTIVFLDEKNRLKS